MDVITNVSGRFLLEDAWSLQMIWIEFDEGVGDTFKFVAAAICILANHGVQVTEAFRR